MNDSNYTLTLEGKTEEGTIVAKLTHPNGQAQVEYFESIAAAKYFAQCIESQNPGSTCSVSI